MYSRYRVGVQHMVTRTVVNAPVEEGLQLSEVQCRYTAYTCGQINAK